jgi:hypothetical protein
MRHMVKKLNDRIYQYRCENKRLRLELALMQDALYFFDKGADNDLVDKAQSHDKNYKPHIRFDKLPSIKWADEELLCWGD